MALSTSQRATLSKNARTNAVQVEHLLKLVRVADAGDVEFLRNLATAHEWAPVNERRLVPLETWCDVVCAFLEDGYAGVAEFARTNRDAIGFCAGVLEQLKTAEAVELLFRLARGARDPEQVARAVEAINLICSFKDAPTLPPKLRDGVRRWLHGLLDSAASERTLASAVCALRGVGNHDSVVRIQRMKPLAEPWTGVEKAAVRDIRRRLGATK